MKIIIPSEFTIGAYSYSDSALSNGRTFKTRPNSIYIPSGEGQGTYKVCDGLAISKCQEIAGAIGVEYKPSWFAHQIAQAILTKVLGTNYAKPTRGASQKVFNLAIFDDYALLHEYENDGVGFSDSIKKGCYVYKK